MTREEIKALAPDSAMLERANGLNDLRNWKLVGRDETAAWGECPGSGAEPYRSLVVLATGAARCSCPVKRSPCKHTLALLLLTADDAPVKFANSEAPVWVLDWLKAVARPKPEPAAAPDASERSDAAEKNLQARMEAMEAGVRDLQIRLSDLVRQGLARISGESSEFWQETAARLVDAKLGGLARPLKALGSIPLQNDDRYEQMTEIIAGLYLFTRAFKNKDRLSPELREDLWAMAGITIKKEDLAALTAGTTGRWLVLGQKTAQEEDNLISRRVWLAGLQTGKIAVILDFAYGKAEFATVWENGRLYTGELIFYPGAYPLRAFPAPPFVREPPEFARYGGRPESSMRISSATTDLLSWRTTFQEMANDYASALGKNPWLTHLPVALIANLIFSEGNWLLTDRENKVLPVRLQRSFSRIPPARDESEDDGLWGLLSLSGGLPARIFGEWNGKTWSMIAAFVGDRALFF